jgi:hypothetical protein
MFDADNRRVHLPERAERDLGGATFILGDCYASGCQPGAGSVL